MVIGFKSLSGLYSGTKNLFKIGETKLPRFIQAPDRALNVEVFNINKSGSHYKDMYVFRDGNGEIVRKYIVKQKGCHNSGYNKHSLYDVDKFDYGRNEMDCLANGNRSRGVDLTIERLKTQQNVTDEVKVPFDYETGRFVLEKPEPHTFIRDVGIERTVTSRVSDRCTGANPVVSKTVFNQAIKGDSITEISKIEEYSKGKAPKWFRAVREYCSPKGTYKRGINDFNGIAGELVIKPNSVSISASKGLPTITDDPYLFLRLHTNKKQFCSEAEPIIARKVGFKKTNSDPEYYRHMVPKSHANDDLYKVIAEEVEAYGKTPHIVFTPLRNVNGSVDSEDMIRPFCAAYGSKYKTIHIADEPNPFYKHSSRVHTLAHESQHLLDGRRMILAQMPIGNNVRFDKNGYLVWNELSFGTLNSISPYAAESLGGWIKPTSPEYAEIKKLREAYLNYGVDRKTEHGYYNNFLEINADNKAKEIVKDYENAFDVKKYFPNLTNWQLG